MTTTTERPTTAALAADPTTGLRRTVGAITLPLAFACQLVCNVLYARAVDTSGLDDTGSSADSLTFYAMFPTEMIIATVFALAGSLLAIPGLLAALRLLRATRPRLALSAVTLMIAGYVCYFGIVTTNFGTLALAVAGVDAGAALDAGQQHPAGLWIFGLFVVGNLIGTLLLGLAVVLSRDLPWQAGALIIGWPVGHVVNIVVGNEWFAVTGGALQVIGLSLLALRALRTSDARWAGLG